MEYLYLEEPLKSYIERLSAKSPCPGGGSAAIVSIALANALVLMVCNFSVGSKKIDENSRRISKEIMDKATEIQPILNKSIEEDSVLYEAIQKTMKDLKFLPEKQQEYQIALRKSVEFHISMLSYCKNIIDWNEKLAEHCNPYLISDVGVSASLIDGALKATRINILVNLNAVANQDYVTDIKRKMEENYQALTLRTTFILQKVESKMSST